MMVSSPKTLKSPDADGKPQIPPMWVSVVVCVALVAGAASFGVRYLPGAWYETLAKPPWTPPNAVFAPAWAVLYVLIAAAGVVAMRTPSVRSLMRLWVGQLALNGAWSVLFFSRHRPDLALIDILFLLAVIATFIHRSWSHARSASLLMTPYLLWITFAASLNAGVWWLNR